MNENEEQHASITAAQILDFAFEVIRASDALIPCGFVLVECSDNLKVQKIYEPYGFTFFQNDGAHFQFYKKI